MDRPDTTEVTIVKASNTADAPPPPSHRFPPRATASAPSSPERRSYPYFSAGEVLSLTFSGLARHPLFYLSLSLLACLPGIALKMSLQGRHATLLAGAADTFFSVIFIAAISFGVYKDLIGEQPRLGEAVARGLSRYAALVGITLLYALGALPLLFLAVILGELLGLIILLVVVLYAVCVFAVGSPACVVEARGPIDSLGRSAELTRGHRGAIFGILLLYGIGSVVVEYGLSAALASYPNGKEIAGVVIQPFSTAIIDVLLATLYYQLRVSKEGVSVDKLARVFD